MLSGFTYDSTHVSDTPAQPGKQAAGNHMTPGAADDLTAVHDRMPVVVTRSLAIYFSLLLDGAAFDVPAARQRIPERDRAGIYLPS